MPYAVNPNDGTRIHYETEGSGAPLVLIHGLAWDLGRWSEYGFLPDLAAGRRVITYELRAHGQSESPDAADSYVSAFHASDAVAVLDDLGIQKAHFFGYSLAAWIGLAVLKHTPERMLSLMLGGIPQSDGPVAEKMIQSRKAGAESTLAEMEQFRGYKASKQDREKYLAQDFEAQTKLLISIRDDKGLFEGLEQTSIPILAYAGTEDPFHDYGARIAASIPSATFKSLESITHPQGVRRSDLIVPLINEFLRGIEATT